MGKHQSRHAAVVLALTALISQMPETQAFAPHLPAFLKPLSPHFLYLGEDAEGLPNENKGGTNVKREFMKARLENRVTKTFIEESPDTTRPVDIDNTFHRSLLEAHLRMESRAANDARSTMSASGDGDGDGDDDDMDDDVFSSELNLQFEAILKDLEEALKDITDELEATATSVDMEREATRDFVIDMSEGQLSFDDNDDGDSNDDYDNSTIISVGSVLGEAVDFIMKTNDKKARAANAYQGVCLGEDSDHMSIVSSYGKHDGVYQYVEPCEQSLYHTLSVKGSSIPPGIKQNNCMTLGQGATISEADDDIHRSILAGRLEIESREKNQIDFNATPSTLCTHISPTSTNTISSHSSAVVKGMTLVARPSYTFQRSLLEARLAMIAKGKGSVTSSKISDQQMNHSTYNKIDFPEEMTSEAHALVSFELEREDSSLPNSAFLPIQDESGTTSQIRASYRRTRVVRRGNEELKERRLVTPSSNERETCEFKGRRTHIIRKGNRNVKLRTQRINPVLQSSSEVEAILLDGQNQAVVVVAVPSVLEAEPRSKAAARLVVTHAVPPSEDTTDTLGNILTNLTKATVSGGMVVFFTLGAMLEASGSSDAIQSSKAVSSSMSKVAQSLSSLVNKTSTMSKVPTLSLTSSDVLRGFQSAITSVSEVCVSYLLSFQRSTH